MSMMTALHTTNSYATTPEAAMSAAVQPKSPWHSPVPYLFGGLAAMLGLIAFALLILACSYWKLSRDNTQQQQQNDGESDLENGDLKGDGLSKVNGVPVFEEKIVVIMAGNDKPTFLAKPAKMLNCNKCNTNDDDDHVMNSHTNAKDDGANKESSSVENNDDADHDDGHHDDDDDKPKEDEPTHHPHTSN